MLTRIAVIGLLALSADAASAGPISFAAAANQLRTGDGALTERVRKGDPQIAVADTDVGAGGRSIVVLMAGDSVLPVAVSLLDTRSPVAQITHQAHTSSSWGVPIGFCLGAASGLSIGPAGDPGSGYLLTVTCAPGTAGKSTGTGTATASLSNHSAISGLTVTDPLGDPVSEDQFASASGTEHDPNGALQQVVAMPEPGSFLMASSGFALVALRRAARRRQTR